METIAQLLARSALEVRARASSARLVGLEPGELEQLADRFQQASRVDAQTATASLQLLARLFDDAGPWHSISPAFVELMGTIAAGSGRQ